jgi:L-asparaginase
MVDQSASSPQLLLLATGGTIAGRADKSTSLNAYIAGAMAGSELLQELPQLQELAQVQVEQLTNLDSADLQFQHWIQLVKRIREAFAASPELAGVVITHGTNTLEETAWLLELLIDDPRPVVLVGAMRPATALSADGPLNLFQAVQVACSPQACGHGVLVVMDSQIHGARAVTKVATQGVGAFQSPDVGPLGWVDDGGVHLPVAPSSRSVPFATLVLPAQWPEVAILYGCVDPSLAMVSALFREGVKGVVWTGTGAGQLSAGELEAIKTWPGVLPLMLRSSRCGSGPVHPSELQDELGLLPAGILNPQKARILLILALMAGMERAELSALLASFAINA